MTVLRLLAVLAFVCLFGVCEAQTPSNSIDEYTSVLRQARAAQARIDAIKAQQQSSGNEMRVIEQDGTTFALRNQELERAILALQDNYNELAADLRAVEETQTGITALLAAMTDVLGEFIELDLPFRREARRAALETVRLQLYRADLGVADKYQSVVTAYLTEIRYGLNNEVYTGTVDTPAGSRVVEILRLARHGLWYVTPDDRYAGRWDTVMNAWVSGEYTDAGMVRRGIQQLRDQARASVIPLPVRLSLP